MKRQEFGNKIKLMALYRAKGRCQKCGAELTTGNIHFHHDRECTMGGSNGLDNCVVLCRTCHGNITGKRAAVIAKSNRQRAKHIGLACASGRSSFATNRSGPFKKKISGEIVRRK